MYRFRLAVICLTLVVCVAAGVVAAQVVPTTPPETVARLPGSIWHVLHQLDGSAVCCTTEGVFLSASDLHRWSAVPNLPCEGNEFQPVGGDRTRFFLEHRIADNLPVHAVGELEDDYSLDRVDAEGKVVKVREKMPRGHCAFASKDVGVIAWSENVMGANGSVAAVRNTFLLTINGGKTWQAVLSPKMAAKFDTIDRLLWVSPSRLLIASAVGAVQLCGRTEDGTLRQVWSVTLRGNGIDLTLDGEYVWIGNGTRTRLSLVDGRVDATVKVDGPTQGVAACHQSLLVWGWDQLPPRPRHYGGMTFEEAKAMAMKDIAAAPGKHIDVWARDLKLGYVRRARIAAPTIATILPLDAPLCLAITNDGQGMHLDLDNDKLSPVALKVRPLPPAPPSLLNLNVATDMQRREMNSLAEQVPQKSRFAIFEAVVNTPGLTPKQQVELATKRFREYLEQHKPNREDKK